MTASQPRGVINVSELDQLERLLERLGKTDDRNTTCPGDEEIGALHVVEENFSGDLRYTSRRKLRYAGQGRWQTDRAGTTYALWHEQLGSVYYWHDVRSSLFKRALALAGKLRADANALPPPGTHYHD